MSLEKGAGFPPVTQNLSYSASDKDMRPSGTLRSPPSDANQNRLTAMSLFNDGYYNNNMSSVTDLSSRDGEDQQWTEVSRKK